MQQEIQENSAKAFDLKLQLYYLEQRERQLHNDGGDDDDDGDSCGSRDGGGEGGGDGDSALTDPPALPFPGVRENPLETIARLSSQLKSARSEVERRDAVLVQVSSAIEEARDQRNDMERKHEKVKATLKRATREHSQEIEKLAIEKAKATLKRATREHSQEIEEMTRQHEQDKDMIKTEHRQMIQEKEWELQEMQTQRAELECSVQKWKEKHESALALEGAATKQLEWTTLERDSLRREKVAAEEGRRITPMPLAKESGAMREELNVIKKAHTRQVDDIMRLKIERDKIGESIREAERDKEKCSMKLSQEKDKNAASERKMEDIASLLQQRCDDVDRLAVQRDKWKDHCEEIRMERDTIRRQVEGMLSKSKQFQIDNEKNVQRSLLEDEKLRVLQEELDEAVAARDSLTDVARRLRSDNDELLRRIGDLSSVEKRQQAAEELLVLCEAQRVKIEALEAEKRRPSPKGVEGVGSSKKTLSHSPANSSSPSSRTSQYEDEYITQLQTQNEVLLRRFREIEARSEAQLDRARKELEEMTRMYKRQGADLARVRNERNTLLGGMENTSKGINGSSGVKKPPPFSSVDEGRQLEAALRQVSTLRKKFREEILAIKKNTQSEVDGIQKQLHGAENKITQLETELKNEQLVIKKAGIEKARMDFNARIDQLDIALTEIETLVKSTKEFVTMHSETRQQINSLDTCKLGLFVERLPARLEGLEQTLHTLLQANHKVALQVQQLGRDLKRVYRGFKKLGISSMKDQRMEVESPSSSVSSGNSSALQKVKSDCDGYGNNPHNNLEHFKGEKKMAITGRSIDEISNRLENIRSTLPP
eukprot:CAMPEP_0194332074 /NCGR_PEP_ID=MMETSP0171-20130528/57907_1 /TAXON_ID=218684 /ORGANISM="Corethron pennatum, Strain L29A3" /LENGTH=826 /DNA_ID=CAMNT_0039093777 /DNA_START=360 /DNA_END=2840 /DNA_ORIENTATION=-